jgi:hypothetical protein
VFHVELRRFPHVARAFNLSAEELQERIVAPWVAGATIDLDDRQWEPARTKLAIYEAPEIAAADRGLGRGWAEVTRAGADVTARVLEQARGSVERFKETLLTHGRLTLREVVALAGQSHPHSRVSDRLGLAERAVWELLHQGRIVLLDQGAEVERDRWQTALLSWDAWAQGRYVVMPAPGSAQ